MVKRLLCLVVLLGKKKKKSIFFTVENPSVHQKSETVEA